jgi:hypothetical protein
VKEEAAQGLATFAEYAADIDKIFVEGKFEQLRSTIELAQKHGGWGNDVVDADTDLAPLVVVPDTGVPNSILTRFDIIERGRKMFHTYNLMCTFLESCPYRTFNCLRGWPISLRVCRRCLARIRT